MRAGRTETPRLGLGRLVLAVLLGLAPAAAAPGAPAGGEPGAVLKLGAGARARGMGGAYTALSGGADAAVWNPANLAQARRQELAAAYALLPAGGGYTQLAYVLPLAAFAFPPDERSGTSGPPQNAALGLHLLRFATAYDIEARQTDTLNPDYLFGDVEVLYGLSFAHGLPYGAAGGVRVKGLSHDLDQAHAQGFGVDLGLAWESDFGLRAGAAVRDVYTLLTWNTGRVERFPGAASVGAAWTWQAASGHELTVSADAEKSFTARALVLRAGAEYGFAGILFLRAGYADGRPAGGGGVRVPSIGWGEAALTVDYALAQDAWQEWSHWAGLRLTF